MSVLWWARRLVLWMILQIILFGFFFFILTVDFAAEFVDEILQSFGTKTHHVRLLEDERMEKRRLKRNLDAERNEMARIKRDLDAERTQKSQLKQELSDQKARANKRIDALEAENKKAKRRASDDLKIYAHRRSVVETKTRLISSRVSSGATRNVASAFGESIPLYGIAINAGVTAWEIRDACETMKDMRAISDAFELDSVQEVDQVCGLDVPTSEEIQEKLVSAPGVILAEIESLDLAELPEIDIGLVEKLVGVCKFIWGCSDLLLESKPEPDVSSPATLELEE